MRRGERQCNPLSCGILLPRRHAQGQASHPDFESLDPNPPESTTVTVTRPSPNLPYCNPKSSPLTRLSVPRATSVPVREARTLHAAALTWGAAQRRGALPARASSPGAGTVSLLPYSRWVYSLTQPNPDLLGIIIYGITPVASDHRYGCRLCWCCASFTCASRPRSNARCLLPLLLLELPLAARSRKKRGVLCG